MNKQDQEIIIDQGYINPSCLITYYGNIKPFKRCDSCTMRAGDCMGMRVNLLVAVLMFMVVVIINISNSIVISSIGFVVIGIAIYISRKVNLETDKMVATSSRLTKSLNESSQMHSALEVAHNDAVSAVKTKDIFLANISHELRTPLNAVIGYSELLTEITEDNNHYEYKDDLMRIHDSGVHLLDIVNELLDMAKIESGKILLSVSVFYFNDLLNEVINVLQPDLDKKSNSVNLVFKDAVNDITSDKIRLKQILINIIGNACKFTENGCIVITVSKKTLGFINISVRDTGIGINNESMKYIFEPFRQGDKSTESYEGTGLGLSISRRLAQMLGGDISVESKEGISGLYRFKQ